MALVRRQSLPPSLNDVLDEQHEHVKDMPTYRSMPRSEIERRCRIKSAWRDVTEGTEDWDTEHAEGTCLSCPSADVAFMLCETTSYVCSRRCLDAALCSQR